MSILRTDGITKDYPGTRALDNVTLTFDSGKVHALAGKNGSGKSTLIKVFSGAIQPSMGKYYLDDEELRFTSPTNALSAGIAAVYQELSLVPYLSVAENIYLGHLPRNGLVIDRKKTISLAGELLQQMDVDIDPNEKTYRLSMWQCQVVEILKAMSHRPKVILLDEPTSALAYNETQRLFDVIRKLRAQGTMIVYISHRLQELWEIADTVTVLRDGLLVGVVSVNDIDHKGVIRMMFGNVDVKTRPDELKVKDETILKVKGLTRNNKFKNVSFELKTGEILGIAGMLGSGRTELLRCVFGADKYDKGEIYVRDVKTPTKAEPIDMKKHGMGLTPEERKSQGLVLTHSIRDNLCYASLNRISSFHIINNVIRKQFAERQIVDLDIKAPSITSMANSLSGGNQQKVVIGNWLNTEPAVMLYDEPTRGIDVGAKQQVFQIMWNQSKKGVSSVFVSSELEELLEVCHRILIMYMGEIIGEVFPEKVKIDDLYAFCMGGKIK